MKTYRFWKVLKICVLVVVAAALFGFVIMHLWNWLMPTLFNLVPITFAQALGLFLLCKILLGGFHRHSGGRGWKRHMEERWAQMTPEQQERFRSGMRGRRGCRFGPDAEPKTDPGTL